MTDRGVTNMILTTEKILSPQNTYENGNAEGVTRGDKYFYDHVGVKKVLVILG